MNDLVTMFIKINVMFFADVSLLWLLPENLSTLSHVRLAGYDSKIKDWSLVLKCLGKVYNQNFKTRAK